MMPAVLSISACIVNLARRRSIWFIVAHLLGSYADKTINLLRRGHSSALFRASELQQVLFTYPTYGSDIRFMV